MARQFKFKDQVENIKMTLEPIEVFGKLYSLDFLKLM